MTTDAQYRNHVNYGAAEHDASVLRRDLDGGCPDDDLGDDTAEICRMIELSGMIGLECGLLEAE